MSISERPSPRISANKLAEYMTCAATRRRRIIRDSKYPPDYVVTRYNTFYDVAPQYASSRPLDEQIVTGAIERISSKETKSEWEEETVQLNVDLFNGLLDLPDLCPIEDYSAIRTGDRRQSIVVAGVEISIRPELILRKDARGGSVIGALKFYLPKTAPLNDISGQYLASLMHWYLEVEFPGESADPRHCFVYDVPSGEVWAGPRSFSRRRSDVEAACEEIASRWSLISM